MLVYCDYLFSMKIISYKINKLNLLYLFFGKLLKLLYTQSLKEDFIYFIDNLA